MCRLFVISRKGACVLVLDIKAPHMTHCMERIQAVWSLSWLEGHIEGDWPFLVGTLAYPMSPFLLIPCNDAQPCSPEDANNFWHSNARITIECFFGEMICHVICSGDHFNIHWRCVAMLFEWLHCCITFLSTTEKIQTSSKWRRSFTFARTHKPTMM